MTTLDLRVSTRNEAKSLRTEGVTVRKMFGLVELDLEGIVLFTRIEPDGRPVSGPAPDYMGQNFYTEVVSFKNVVEFRQLLDNFIRGSLPAHSTDFTCDYEDGPLCVRVLLARIREPSQADATRSVLVHIQRRSDPLTGSPQEPPPPRGGLRPGSKI